MCCVYNNIRGISELSEYDTVSYMETILVYHT